MGDLIAHHAGLLGDLVGEGSLLDLGLVDDHAQGRLQGVGQIADLGPRALDHVAIGGDHEVELARERRDVDGIDALDPLAIAAADRGDTQLQMAQRLQSVAQRDRRGGGQHEGEDREGHGEFEFEAAHLRLDLVGRGGDLDQEDALVAGIDHALDHPQRAVVRAFHVAPA